MAEQHTYSGVLTGLGGPEIGSTGNEKPRKVLVKADIAQQHPKVFRCWSKSDTWEQLQPLINKPVTITFVTEQRQGPKGPYPQNNILSVAEGSGGGWDTPSGEAVWGSAESSDGAQSPPVLSKDDYWAHREVMDEQRSQHMAAAWSISQAIALFSIGEEAKWPNREELENVAHQLLVLKEQIVAETSQ